MTRKEEIFRESSRLFHEKGYAATSMREIALAVGIEASSLYNHIHNKAHLLEEICFSVSSVFRSHIEEVSLMNCDPLKKIERLFDLHVDLAYKDYSAITAFDDEWRHLSKKARSKFIKERKSYEKYWEEVILEGQKSGQFKPNVDADVLVKIMLSSIRWIHFTKKEKKEKRESIMKIWKNLIFEGIAC